MVTVKPLDKPGQFGSDRRWGVAGVNPGRSSDQVPPARAGGLRNAIRPGAHGKSLLPLRSNLLIELS
jgi:hypothetical protein